MTTLRTTPQGTGAGNSYFSVDLDVMNKATNYFDSALQGMVSEVNRWLDDLDPLSANWQSDAATAFQTAKDNWVTTHKALITAGGEIVSALQSTHKDYGTSDLDSLQGIQNAARPL